MLFPVVHGPLYGFLCVNGAQPQGVAVHIDPPGHGIEPAAQGSQRVRPVQCAGIVERKVVFHGIISFCIIIK